MAEKVKRRVAAARSTIAFVVAGTIAGAAWAQAGPHLKLTGDDVINGSLSLKDFAKGEVPTLKQFKKLKSSTTGFKKSAQGEIGAIEGELGTYIKGTEADARYLKQSDPVVHGDGSVFTASQAVSGEPPAGIASVRLIGLPSFITVDALIGKPRLIQITNDSGVPLTHTRCGEGGGLGTPGVTQPGGHFFCQVTDSSVTLQLLVDGPDPTVATLTASAMPIVGSENAQFMAQILIGT